MRLLPEVPDAAFGVVQGLALADALAVRAASSEAARLGTEALAKTRSLRLAHTVQGVPATDAPGLYSGVLHLALARGIMADGSAFGDLAREMAAAVRLAWRFPRARRVDLEQYDCALLLSRRSPSEPPDGLPAATLRHCFAFSAGGDRGEAAQLEEEAALCAQLLRAARGFGGEALRPPGHARKGWAPKLARLREASCSAAGTAATAFVAHAVDTAAEAASLAAQVRLLPNLEELTVLWWPAPGAAGRRRDGAKDGAQDGRGLGAAAREQLRASCPRLRFLEQSWASPACQRVSSEIWAPLQPDRAPVGLRGSAAVPRSSPRAAAAAPRAAAQPAPGAAARPPRRTAPQSPLRGMRLAGFGTAEAVWGYMNCRR